MKKGNVVIYNADEVVTCHGFKSKSGKEMQNLGILNEGSIVVEDGIIVKITEEKLDLNEYKQKGYYMLNGKDKCVTPGFIDSHTHLVFGGYRENEYNDRLLGKSYKSIMDEGGGIVNSVKSTRESSKETLTQLAIKHLNQMMRFGVTTVEGKSGYGLDLETEIKQLEVMKILNKIHSMDIVTTFLGPHALPEKYKDHSDEFISFMIDEVLPIVDQRDLAEFADIFCEVNVFSVEQSRRFLLEAKKRGIKVKIHADEMSYLGASELAGELGAISADHLLYISDKGIQSLIKAGTVATLLPCTAYSLNEPYAPARKIIDRGGTVALATDFNPGSCFTESIPLLMTLATQKMNMTIEETITALTINGAAALDRADQIGSIDIGKKADILVHEFPSYRFLAYHLAVSTVETVIKNGNIVYNRGDEKPL